MSFWEDLKSKKRERNEYRREVHDKLASDDFELV